MSDTNSTDLSAILSRPATEVKEIPPLPVGQYLCTVDDFKFEKNQKSGNQQVYFEITVVSALEADPSALEGIEFPTKTRYYFTLSPAAQIFAKQFLTNALKIPEDNLTFGEMFNESRGKHFRANFTQAPNRLTGRLTSNISEALPID